jgi:hypothetical protein
MQHEFFARLSPAVQSLVKSLEAKTGLDVTVEVSPDRARNLACTVDEAGATLKTYSVDYFPDGGVFHELRHIERLTVEGLPRLIDNPGSAAWTWDIDEALHKLDNTLEHFVIVPEELSAFPERHDRWTESLFSMWREDVPGLEPGQEQTSWALVNAVFTSLAFPGSEVELLAMQTLTSLNLMEKFHALHAAVLPVVKSKEDLVRVVFDHLGVPRDIAKFKYLDVQGKALRETAIFR